MEKQRGLSVQDLLGRSTGSNLFSRSFNFFHVSLSLSRSRHSSVSFLRLDRPEFDRLLYNCGNNYAGEMKREALVRRAYTSVNPVGWTSPRGEGKKSEREREREINVGESLLKTWTSVSSHESRL